MKHRRAPFTLAAVLLAACALGGCRAVNRTITDKAYEAYNQNGTRFGWIGGRTYKLDDASLAEIPFEGVAEFENVRVSYPHGLADQALHIAEHVAHVSQTASEAIALNFTHDPHAYLLRVDNLPGAVDISLKVDPNTMPLPLFVQAGRDDWRTILAESTIFPYAIVHELTEASLVMPRAGNPVAPDLVVQYLLPVQLAVKNYTRWFRDGLANYAGYVAYQTSAAQIDYTAETSPLHRHPFSSLARVGDDLFTWHQYSDAEKNDDYYNAAFGLFLLIEHRNGIDAIRGMVAGKDALEFADGKAMIALADEVLNADIRKLAADFRFPQTGLELAQVTKDDVIYDLGCGDGRIVVTAALKYGCKGVGYDIDPKRVSESRANVKKNNVENLVRIEQEDIFTLDLRQASVITLYLLPDLNVKLIPQLEKLKDGSRIVSHDFDMRGVQPDKIITIEDDEDDYGDHTIYLWTTPLKRTDQTVQ